jgi:hypothetical protein
MPAARFTKNHEHSHLASWAQIEVAQAGAKDLQTSLIMQTSGSSYQRRLQLLHKVCC